MSFLLNSISGSEFNCSAYDSLDKTAAQRMFANGLEMIINHQRGRCLIIEDDGSIHYAGKIRQLFEEIKGWCGWMDHTRPEVIQERTFKILQYGEEQGFITKEIQRQLKKLSEKIENLSPVRIFPASEKNIDSKEFVKKISGFIAQKCLTAAIQPAAPGLPEPLPDLSKHEFEIIIPQNRKMFTPWLIPGNLKRRLRVDLSPFLKSLIQWAMPR
jgi:hypothetical protein